MVEERKTEQGPMQDGVQRAAASKAEYALDKISEQKQKQKQAHFIP